MSSCLSPETWATVPTLGPSDATTFHAQAAPGLLADAPRGSALQAIEELAGAGVPHLLAERVAHLEALFPTWDLVELAGETGADVEQAARAYFTLGERLELHVLHERIGALPRQERWEALARRALLEDLHSERRALTGDVLRTSEGPDAVGAWIERNAVPVERCLQVLADVRAGGAFDLATLSVAVREIRNLIDATSAP